MASVCFYFHAHQPRRVRRYTVFNIGQDSHYFQEEADDRLSNIKILKKVATKCYLPANETFLKLLKKHPEMRVSYSLSGVFLDQLEEHAPEVLDSYRRLVDTGQVELIAETYYHSLAFLYSKKEFKRQVEMHMQRIKDLFGVTPTIFRNTELIYNNDVAKVIKKMGFKGIITEGADQILGWRSPNFIYKAKGTANMPLLLKNYRLSDDIAFRFSSRDWSEFPLTAPKYAQWISAVNGSGELVNLFMDYETFGEHQWEDTGIFRFLEQLPEELLKHPDNDFVTPSEAIKRYHPVSELDVPNYISWADIERDLSAWLENDMQRDSIAKLFALEKKVLSSQNEELISDWRLLQTSDHFYYMCTKWFADGDVHKYFNPYESPYTAFISFMNVLHDLRLRLGAA